MNKNTKKHFAFAKFFTVVAVVAVLAIVVIVGYTSSAKKAILSNVTSELSLAETNLRAKLLAEESIVEVKDSSGTSIGTLWLMSSKVTVVLEDGKTVDELIKTYLGSSLELSGTFSLEGGKLKYTSEKMTKLSAQGNILTFELLEKR